MKLPAPELKPFEIMTKEQELQLEFLRISMSKKAQHKAEQLRKGPIKRVSSEIILGVGRGRYYVKRIGEESPLVRRRFN